MDSRTRPMHWEPPGTVACDVCQGSGRFKGMFHSGPCASCDGAGIVSAETGEALPASEIVPVLRHRYDDLEQRVRRLLSHPEVSEIVEKIKARRAREAAEKNRVGSRFD